MHYAPDFLRGKGCPVWPRGSQDGAGGCVVCLEFLLFWFSAFICLSPRSTALTAAQLAVSGSAYRGCWGPLRCGVPWEGGEMPGRSGALCCDTTGSCRGPDSRARGEQSRFQAAECPEGSCLPGSAAGLHCTELLCSLFCFLQSLFPHFLGCHKSAVGPSLLMSC